MVEPTNLKPRRSKSLLMASDCGVRAGSTSSALPAVLHRPAIHESPDVAVEAAEFLLHFEERLRVGDRRGNLETIAHDARIAQQRGNPGGIVARHFARIEIVESLAVGRALLQNRDPAQTGLRPFENEELEQAAGRRAPARPIRGRDRPPRARRAPMRSAPYWQGPACSSSFSSLSA